MSEYDKKPVQAKAAPTAGPAQDDRYGAGKVGSNLNGRILKADEVEGRILITISQGKSHGAHAGMLGYIKSTGGMMADFQLHDAQEARCTAFVESVTSDEVKSNPYVVINPTTMPRKTMTKDTWSRVIAISEADKGTTITIGRGSRDGVTHGMSGTMRAADGHDETFTVIEVTARNSKAVLKSTVAHVTANRDNIVLHPNAAPSRGAVQRRANGTAATTTDVNATAQAGVAGANSRLPHFDAIQRSFGKHNISGIQAQVGGAATDASQALGAQAYATGNKVAFASAPDLHTAAHEAAHTIQQSRGAVGFQGLGAADDKHEQHADAVADAVVAGKSAEPLLDQPSGAGQGNAVQRKPSETGGGFGAPVPRKGIFEIDGVDLTKPQRGFGGVTTLSIAKADPAPRVSAGKSATFSVQIKNESTGFVPLEVFMADPLLPGSPIGSTVFKVVQVNPQVVEPMGTATVTVEFRPPSVGSFDAYLDVGTRKEHQLSVSLKGVAVADPAKQKPEQKEKPAGPTISVDVLDKSDDLDLTEQATFSYQQLMSRWLELLKAGLTNYDLALQNLESVMRTPSSKETVQESDAAVIFGEITKHLFDHVASYMLKPLSFGPEIGEFLAFATWSEAIKNEKKRAARAGEDHAIMRYITGFRKRLGAQHAGLANKATGVMHRQLAKHETHDVANQALDRNDIMVVNERYAQHITSGGGTVAGVFASMVCDWTNKTKIPGSKQDSRVRLRYDRDWNFMFAKLEAPRGERLAEELTQDGAVDLQTLPVRKLVEWKPFMSKDAKHHHMHQAAVYLSREIDEKGATVETQWSEMAAHLRPAFEAKVGSLVLPNVTEMRGTSSK